MAGFLQTELNLVKGVDTGVTLKEGGRVTNPKAAAGPHEVRSDSWPQALTDYKQRAILLRRARRDAKKDSFRYGGAKGRS
jgi:hypothetical protein